MISFPSRIDELIRRLEVGEAVTQQDVDRIAQLQALDLAKLGEDFMRQACEEQDRRTQEFLEVING